MTRLEALRLFFTNKKIISDGHIYIRLDEPSIETDSDQEQPDFELVPVVQLM